MEHRGLGAAEGKQQSPLTIVTLTKELRPWEPTAAESFTAWLCKRPSILSLLSDPLLLQLMLTTKKTVFASQDAVAECLPFPLLAQSSLDASQNTPVDPNNFKNHLDAKLDIFHIFLTGDLCSGPRN